MVFLSGRGGGQGGFPVRITPSIGLETAGGGTAGRAQLGIVGWAVGVVGVMHAWGLGAGDGNIGRTLH